MNKRILLIGYNFHPEPTGIGKYSGEMMDWFHKHGYDCAVITSYPYYPYWKVQEPYRKNRFWYLRERSTNHTGGELNVIRCPQYVPEAPSGLKRILLDFSFFLSALFPLLGLLTQKKYDVVMTVAPSFQIGLLGVLYKKIKGAKHVYHIQDMQIEAARDLKMIKSKGLINTLFRMEKYIFDQTDVVSSISEGMVERISAKAKKPVYTFANWTDTRQFFPISDRSEVKRSFGYSPDDKIVLYSGSIGEKQGLEAIINAANNLRHHPSIKFVICGSGPYKQVLEKMAKDLKLTNLAFLPIQPFEKFNQFLNLADVHLVIQKSGASDLVMPSKLTTILSVGGLALITANKGTGLNTLVKNHHVGIVVDSENQKALEDGILEAVLEDTTELRMNARTYAENNLAIDMIMNRFADVVFGNTQSAEAHRSNDGAVISEKITEISAKRDFDGRTSADDSRVVQSSREWVGSKL